jgi:peroxiredoxin
MKVGDKAPDFRLVDQHGEEFRLSENLSKRVMLVFYPKDESLVCTKQLCDYNNNLEEFRKQDIEVVGISIDDQLSHKKFADRYSLNFRILSDKAKVVSRKYEAMNILGLNKRKVILIDQNGIILYENTILPFLYQNAQNLLKKGVSESINKTK